MNSDMWIIACSARGKDADGRTRPAGISIHDFSSVGERKRSVVALMKVKDASFLAYSKKHGVVYVASETSKEGNVTALRLADKGLSLLNVRETGGPAAVHASLDANDNFLFVANYMADGAKGSHSVSVLPILPDGSLGPICSTGQHLGSGKDPQRQEAPHCHCVISSPDNRMLAAIDLGTDSVWLYDFDPAKGAITPRSQILLPSGSGPRHGVFHPSKPLLYVTGELDSILMTLRYDPSAGTGTLLDSVPATAASSPRNFPSGIVISPDGHYLLLANRGADTIATFWIDPDAGLARLRDETPCGGTFPRALRLDPTARLLAVANQKSRAITLFERDFATGRLAVLPGSTIDLPVPLDMILVDKA